MRNAIPFIFVLLVGGLYTLKHKQTRKVSTPTALQSSQSSKQLGSTAKNNTSPALNKNVSKSTHSSTPKSKKPGLDRQALMKRIRAMLAKRRLAQLKKQKAAQASKGATSQPVSKTTSTASKTPTKKPAFDRQALMKRIRAMLAKRRLAQLKKQQAAQAKAPVSTPPVSKQVGSIVELRTSLGTIQLKLFRKKAPITTANFLQYVRSGHYNGTIFHRVIPNFMVQGGGLTANMVKKPTRAPIKNEADNGLKNEVGTVAMARTGAPHSASAQFFINTKNNGFLNFRGKYGRAWGYCVFAKVIKGMDVVSKISATRTGFKGGRRNVPVTPIVIKEAVVLQ